jgi:hypothetical protein
MQPPCDDIQFIFARGSGGHSDDWEYARFKTLGESLNKYTTLKYSFHELGVSSYGGYKYIATGDGFVMLGAKIGGVAAIDYNISVESGIGELKAYISSRESSCPNTKYVLAGYSQGAQVIGETINYLGDNVLYSALYGDPKLHLPEGKGSNPPACRGANLSFWRAYAPCSTYKGVLNARVPYVDTMWRGKVGLWCNDKDAMCGSSRNILNNSGHRQYADPGGLIGQSFNPILSALYGTYPAKFKPGFTPKAYKVDTTPFDTVILISKPGYTGASLSKRRSDIMSLASSTLAKNGRIALISVDQSSVTVHCSFGCTTNEISAELDGLVVGNNKTIKGDILKGLNKALDDLSWRKGAQKSAAIFTESGYLGSEQGKTALKAVTDKALKLDPVNMYVITDEDTQAEYQDLVNMNSGAIITANPGEELQADLANTVLSRPSALLTNPSYWALPGQEVYFDASESYTMDDSTIVKYDWDLDGDGEFELNTTEPQASRLYPQTGETTMQVKVTDSLGRFSTMSAPVYVQDNSPFDDSSDATPPARLKAKLTEGQVELTWQAPAAGTSYYMIYLNDTPLGYVDASQGALTITDLESTDSLEFTAIGISEDGYLGKESATASWINGSDQSEDEEDEGSGDNGSKPTGSKDSDSKGANPTHSVKSSLNPTTSLTNLTAFATVGGWVEDLALTSNPSTTSANNTGTEPSSKTGQNSQHTDESRSEDNQNIWHYLGISAAVVVVVGLVVAVARRWA